ncbi:MAG: matrixin family metalloprotease, partial [Nitriliruptoraceae bacterium]
AGWRADFDAAIEVIEAASPARLRIAASTDEGPSPDRASFQPDRYGDRWAPVLVAWASADTFDVLRGHDRGVAIPVAVGATDTRVFVTGQVVFPRDRDDLQVGADDRAAAWRATFLHELLHLLGLAHVDDADAMMHRYPGAGPIALSDGDRAGLKAVTSGDCITPPEPRHVRVNTLLP